METAPPHLIKGPKGNRFSRGAQMENLRLLKPLNQMLPLILLSLAFTALPSPAVTIFDNTNNSAGGYAVGLYPGSTNVFIDAFPFTVTGGSFRLDTVGLLESSFAATLAPGGLSLFLYSDSSGLPSTVLESWQGVPVPPTISRETVASVSNPVLQKDRQYWFGVTTTSPNETAVWWINPATQSAGCASINGGAFSCSPPGNQVGAFVITGTPTTVPELGTLALFGIGLICMVVCRGTALFRS
jgi:hypothetical protein